jgi:hypothetical protein
MKRPRSRSLTTLALTLGLVFAPACKPAGDGSKAPGAKPTADQTADAGLGDGSDYVYAPEGFSLVATMSVKFELSTSEGAGKAEIAARSLLQATPSAGGKLKVHGKVLELQSFQGSGQLDPEFMKKQAEERGQEAVDMVAELRKAESWMIMDAKGELDEAASKALPENQGADDDSDFGLFNLPDLPDVDLVEGKKITLPTKRVDRQLPFGTIPVEIDRTWTLRRIDNGVAEIDVSIEGSGATEFSGQGATALVSTLEESSFTLFFNLETKLPVSFSGYSRSETSIDAPGQSFTFSVNNEIEATYATATDEDLAAAAQG